MCEIIVLSKMKVIIKHVKTGIKFKKANYNKNKNKLKIILERDDSQNRWITTTSYYALYYMNMMKCYTQGFGSTKEVKN